MERIIILLLLVASTKVIAQQNNILKLSEAIEQALEHNQDIKIQKVETALAEQQVFKANAGLGPSINAIANATYANNFANVELRTFVENPNRIEIEESGVETFTGSIGVQLDYILYDGKRGTYRYQLLEGQSLLAKAQQQVLANETIFAVAQIYLNLMKLQKQTQFLQENIENSRARIQKIKDRKQFGKATGLDILQLETALLQDEAALDDVNLAMRNLRTDLNFLIGKTVDEAYRVENLNISDELPSITSIRQAINTHNPQVLLSNQGIALADIAVQLQQAERKPIITSFANLGYFQQNNDVQQLAKIQTFGPTIGIGAQYKIFDGGVRKNRIQNAKKQVQINQLQKENLEDQLFTQAVKARNQLLLLEQQAQREQQNLNTFQEAYNRIQSRYENGKASALDLRDAQLALLNINLRIDQLKVDKMIALFELRKLSGNLIQ